MTTRDVSRRAPARRAQMTGGALTLLLALAGCGTEADVTGAAPGPDFVPPPSAPVGAEIPTFGDGAAAPPEKVEVAGATPFVPRRGARIQLKRRGPAQPGDRFEVPFAPDGPCDDRCGDDSGCRLLCAVGELPPAAGGGPNDPRAGTDCLVCGRETGFLPKPDLRIESLDASGVTLAWDAVEGADQYVLHGLRWARHADGLEEAGSFELSTRQTRVHITLQPGYAYGFFVVAWDADGKRRSPPSVPLHVDP